ncbi:MAG TPA: dihydropteroate synthase [Candidatus Binataceae bacterium]|nr:dihydropteroate synthase [Candidatus Binataceae bacterium]
MGPKPSRRRARRLKLADGRVIDFPAVMGILNVTPDSFRDGGRYLDRERAVDHAIEMAGQGADIIDVGGESTRPGAAAVPVDEELRRVIPVIAALAGRLRVPISVDTRKAAVARAALDAGAAIINDVSALEFDCEMASVAARARAAVVLMHMRGTPETMATMAEYRDLVAEVCRYLRGRVRAARAAGISAARLIVDPGFGFAKRGGHNLTLIRGLPRVAALGYPVLIGFSGKALGLGLGKAGEGERTARLAAAEAVAVMLGASILRVHDPGPTVAAIKVAASITGAVRV